MGVLCSASHSELSRKESDADARVPTTDWTAKEHPTSSLLSVVAHGAFLAGVWRTSLFTSQPAHAGYFCGGRCPACREIARRGELMPGLPMRFHLVASHVKCPACGADLTFIRVRGYGDLLYQCVSDPCRRQVMHYQRKDSKTCGCAALSHHGVFGVRIACDMPAAKE